MTDFTGSANASGKPLQPDSPAQYKRGQQASAAMFDRLTALSRRRVYNHACRLLGNPAEAEDVTQDAYVRAWQHFDRYDSRRPFEPWLLRIVTNRVIDLKRRQKRVPVFSLNAFIQHEQEGQPLSHEFIAPGSDPAEILLTSIMDAKITRAIAALPLEHQGIFHLLASEQLTYQEAADRLHCPVGTVRSRVYRARTRLRADLQ